MIFLDIETTGTEKEIDDIIDIALIKVDDNFNVIDEFSSLIKTNKIISPFVSSLTGITNDMLKDSPILNDISDKIKSMCDNEIICGHNINFDVNFLIEKGVDISSSNLVDTYFLSHLLLTEKKLINYSQEYIAYYLDIKYVPHRAFSDAKANLEIFKKLFDILTCINKDKLINVINFLNDKNINNYNGYVYLFKKAIEFNKNVDIDLNKIPFSSKKENFENTDLINIDHKFNENKSFEILELSKSNFDQVLNEKISLCKKPLLIITNEFPNNIDINNKNIAYLNELYKYNLDKFLDYLKNLQKLNDPQIRLLIKLIFYLDKYNDLSSKFDIKFTYDENVEIQNIFSKLNLLNDNILPEYIKKYILNSDLVFAKYDLILTDNSILDYFDDIFILNYDELYNYAIDYYKKKITISDIKDDINSISNITRLNSVLNDINNFFLSLLQPKNNKEKYYKSIFINDINDENLNRLYLNLLNIVNNIDNVFKNTDLYVLLDILSKKYKYCWVDFYQNKLTFFVVKENILDLFYKNIANKNVFVMSNSIFDLKEEINFDIRFKFDINNQDFIKKFDNINIIKKPKKIDMYHLYDDEFNLNDKDIYYIYIANVIMCSIQAKNNAIVLFNNKEDIKGVYNLLCTKKDMLNFEFFGQNILGWSILKHKNFIRQSLNKTVLLALYENNFLNTKEWLNLFDLFIIAKLPIDMKHYDYYKLWCRYRNIDYQIFFNQRKFLKIKKFFDMISECDSNIIVNADPNLFEYLDEKDFLNAQYLDININKTKLRKLCIK